MARSPLAFTVFKVIGLTRSKQDGPCHDGADKYLWGSSRKAPNLEQIQAFAGSRQW
jgi:hypothetical protein